jgi:hypothetical protein
MHIHEKSKYCSIGGTAHRDFPSLLVSLSRKTALTSICLGAERKLEFR